MKAQSGSHAVAQVADKEAISFQLVRQEDQRLWLAGPAHLFRGKGPVLKEVHQKYTQPTRDRQLAHNLGIQGELLGVGSGQK
jgi:hypothetical protein